MLVPVLTPLIAAKPTPNMPVLWTTLALVVVLLIGAVVIALVDRWRKRAASAERQSAGDQLSHFRTLYERGELSREEYERIRALLSERLRQDLQLPGPGEGEKGSRGEGEKEGQATTAPPLPLSPSPPPPGPEPPPPPETGIRNGPPPG